MAKSIGTFAFNQWLGFMNRPQKLLSRLPGFPGTNGGLIIAGGKDTEPSRISTTFVCAPAQFAVDTGIAYETARNSLLPVSVVDQFGITWTNCTILAVNWRLKQLTDGFIRLEADWIINQYTSP